MSGHMDTWQRALAVRDRLKAGRDAAVDAKRFGPACGDCIHFVPKPSAFSDAPRCGHLAYTEQVFNPSRGEFIERHPTRINVARADNGLCGPEGLLFEGPTRLQVISKHLVGNARLYVLSGWLVGMAYLYWNAVY